MNLTDLAPMERWTALEQEINDRTGLDANVFNPEGYRISDVKNWANRLCPEIKATDKGQSFICAPAHMNIAAMAMNQRKAVIEECDAGMIKMVVPFVGAVGACGLLLDDGEVDGFLVNKMTDIEEEKVLRLSEGISGIRTAEAEALARFISDRIEEILSEKAP
jgi:ligand-binding sensor protein